MSAIRSWDEKPAEISQENWGRIRAVYKNPGFSLSLSLLNLSQRLKTKRLKTKRLKTKIPKTKILKTKRLKTKRLRLKHCFPGDIDAYTGTLAEQPVKGGLVGLMK